MPSSTLQEIVEYRGVEGLVAAEVITDDADTFETGDVFAIAGIATVNKTTDSSSEAHYYDNIPAIVVTSTSSDEVTFNVSALPLDVVGKLTGQTYDPATGALIEGERETKYFAVGYKTEKTNGDVVYVWRMKGLFGVPAEESNTKNNGTDASGQELVYTGISTTHKFAKNGKGAKALVVDTGKDLADVSTFFDTVTTPDTLLPKTAYTLTKTQGSDTTLSVKRHGVEMANGADIYIGDELKITVTGGTVTVNTVDFTSGDIHVVSGNTAVVSTAS